MAAYGAQAARAVPPRAAPRTPATRAVAPAARAVALPDPPIASSREAASVRPTAPIVSTGFGSSEGFAPAVNDPRAGDLMKLPPSRGVSSQSQASGQPTLESYPQAVNGHGVSTQVRRPAVAAPNGGDDPVISYYQDEPARPAVTNPNGGNAPVISYYQDERPGPVVNAPAVVATHNGGNQPVIEYYQEQIPRPAVNNHATQSNNGADPFVGFHQGEVLSATVNHSTITGHTGPVVEFYQGRGENISSAEAFAQDQPCIPLAQTAALEPNSMADSDVDILDLMDIDDDNLATNVYPVLDPNASQNASEHFSASFPVLPTVGKGTSIPSISIPSTSDTQKGEQKCTCVKGGLGRSRWAESSQSATCPVHTPRVKSPLTPTAPEFVPRSGALVSPLTPEIAGENCSTRSTESSTFASRTFQVPTGNEEPWVLL